MIVAALKGLESSACVDRRGGDRMEQATYDYSTGKIHSPTARASAVHSSSEHTRLTDVRGTDRTYAFDRFRLNHARRFFTFKAGA